MQTSRTNIPTKFLYLKYLQSIDSSFATTTKPSNHKIGERFCEGLKGFLEIL